MASADLILFLERGLEPEDWRSLAGGLAEQAGIRSTAAVGREEGRLVHVRFDPEAVSPSTVGRKAHELGYPGRIAAL